MTIQAKPPTRKVTLYLGGDLDLVDEYQRLKDEPATSLAGTDRARLAEVEEQLRADSVTFRFEALGRRSLQKLMDKHPPRADNNRDQVYGFNQDTATAELIRRCLVEPELSDEALTDLLEEQLTDGQYERLANTVWPLNRRSVDIPFSSSGSASTRSSAAG